MSSWDALAFTPRKSEELEAVSGANAMVEFAGSTVECHFRSLVSLNLVSKSEDFMIQWCKSGDQRQQAAETQKKMQQLHAHMECQIMRAPQFTAKLVNTFFSLPLY